MFNAIFPSNKFSPGSPDCLLSIENTVNLKIAAAFVRASLGSLFPVLFNKTQSASSRGRDFHYRGSFNLKTGNLCGRGISYEGSLFSPIILNMGRFDRLGNISQGYMYGIRNRPEIFHAAITGNSHVVNITNTKGEFVRGVLPFTNTQPNLQLIVFSQKKNSGFPLPTGGGEIHGIAQNGFLFKGTFQPNGIYLGSITFPNNGHHLEGIFSVKESIDGLISIDHISGTKEVITSEDGTKLKFNFPCSDPFEGRETSPNGSFREGLFSFDNENQIVKQVSGTFKKIGNNGIILEGKIIEASGKWEGSMTYPDGSMKQGVFSVTQKAPRRAIPSVNSSKG